MVNIWDSKFKDQKKFNELLSWFLSKKSYDLNIQGKWFVDLIAHNIVDLYLNLPKKSNKTYKKKIIEIKKINSNNYLKRDKNYLKVILEIKKHAQTLKPYLYDFLIHGSIATLDYSKGWSDLDTFVIIKNSTLKSSKRLIILRKKILKLENCLYKIDPLQHHGFIYCTEYDIKNYNSFLLPTQVLTKSKSLFVNNKFILNYNRKRKYWKKILAKTNQLLKDSYKNKLLKHHKYKDKYLLDNFKDKNTMYQMKYFLSIIMILPCLYLEAKGQPCYKKYSFFKTKNLFKKNWEIIDKATKIRLIWSKKEKHPYKTNNIPQWLINELGGNYFKRAYLLSKIMLKKVNVN